MSCIEALAPRLEQPCLIVGKSTIPVGTAAWLAGRVAELAPAGTRVQLAWNPEFLREGFAVADTLRPERIVVGVRSAEAEAILREVYAEPITAGVPFLVTSYETAELVKIAANAFLATKISFINAMAEVCEAAHTDVTELAEALAYDHRIGPASLRPGLGFGGGCLPKDIRAFMTRAAELGAAESVSFLREMDAINGRRRARMVGLAEELAGGSLAGCRVGVLGLAFKPDSDDIRDSRRWPWRPPSTPGGPGSPPMIRSPWTGPGGRIRNSATPARSSARPRRLTCCSCSPSGRSSARRILRSSGRRCPGGTWRTGGTRSTPRPGGPRAGPTGHSDAPSGVAGHVCPADKPDRAAAATGADPRDLAGWRSGCGCARSMMMRAVGWCGSCGGAAGRW